MPTIGFIPTGERLSDSVAFPRRVGEYDIEFYQQRTILAAESVLAPLGWRRSDIELYLADYEDASITAY